MAKPALARITSGSVPWVSADYLALLKLLAGKGYRHRSAISPAWGTAGGRRNKRVRTTQAACRSLRSCTPGRPGFMAGRLPYGERWSRAPGSALSVPRAGRTSDERRTEGRRGARITDRGCAAGTQRTR